MLSIYIFYRRSSYRS